MYHPPSWATGYVSRGDAEFLFELIAAERPRTVVELGVASGASSAAILCALDQLPEINGGRVLYSCDVRSTCYFNESFATGHACSEMYPDARTRWRTEFDVDARRLARVLPRGSVDLTFIDANHAHPWPLLDLLHVTAVAKPRSWVVLHDVDLPIHYPEYQVYGPRWLFQAWPFNKVKGAGRWVSIAAVQLPEDPAALMPVASGSSNGRGSTRRRCGTSTCRGRSRRFRRRCGGGWRQRKRSLPPERADSCLRHTLVRQR